MTNKYCRKLQLLQFFKLCPSSFQEVLTLLADNLLATICVYLGTYLTGCYKAALPGKLKNSFKKDEFGILKFWISVKSCWERKILKLIWQISFGKISWSDFRIHDRVCQFLLADLIFDVVILLSIFFLQKFNHWFVAYQKLLLHPVQLILAQSIFRIVSQLWRSPLITTSGVPYQQGALTVSALLVLYPDTVKFNNISSREFRSLFLIAKFF